MDQEQIKKYSKTCKQFKKKKSLGFFILILDPDTKELKHRELLRVVNPKDGENYIVPRPLDKFDFHISYHKSGKFHWTLEKKHELPKESENDFRKAFSDYLKIQSNFRWIIGYCIAVGPKVKIKPLKKMLEILSRYIPVSGLESRSACQHIFNRKHVSIWNEAIKSPDDIKEIPMATGIMLVEIKESIGSLHTINVSFTSDRDKPLVYHRLKWNNEGKKMEFNEILYEDIAEAYCVFM